MSERRSVVTKRVKAFPISTQLKRDAGVINGNIMKLTTVGFLVEVPVPDFKIGDKMEVSFEFPVIHKNVTEQGVVIKLYNQFGGMGKTENHSVVMLEIHFRSLSSKNKALIGDFLKMAHGAGKAS